MKQFLSVLLCLALVFNIFLVPARAEPASMAMVATAAYFVVAAGFVFATTGDLQQACTSFVNDMESAFDFCGRVANTFADGIVTVTSDALEYWPQFWSDLKSYFGGGSISVPTENVYYFDHLGNSVSFYEFTDPTADFGYIPALIDLPFSIGDDFYFYITEDTYYHYSFGPGKYGWDNFSYNFSFYVDGVLDLAYGGNSGVDAIGFGLMKYIVDGNSYIVPFHLRDNGSNIRYSVILSTQPSLFIPDSLLVHETDILTIPVDSKGNTDAVGDALTTVLPGDVALDLDGTGVLDDVMTGELTNGLTATQTGVLENVGALELIPEWEMMEFDDYTMPSLSDRFPFCIPFDLVALVSAFNAPPVAPYFVIPIDMSFVGYEGEIVLDLSEFESIAEVIRWSVIAFFILGLIIISRKVIQG